MATTFIDTNRCPRVKLGGARGEAAEIVNGALCGAKNVKGSLLWLRPGERFDTEAPESTHQLFYVMEGEGTITLAGKAHAVAKGCGVYLAPSEKAGIGQRGNSVLKLFQLAVPAASSR